LPRDIVKTLVLLQAIKKPCLCWRTPKNQIHLLTDTEGTNLFNSIRRVTQNDNIALAALSSRAFPSPAEPTHTAQAWRSSPAVTCAAGSWAEQLQELATRPVMVPCAAERKAVERAMELGLTPLAVSGARDGAPTAAVGRSCSGFSFAGGRRSSLACRGWVARGGEDPMPHRNSIWLHGTLIRSR